MLAAPEPYTGYASKSGRADDANHEKARYLSVRMTGRIPTVALYIIDVEACQLNEVLSVFSLLYLQ